MSTSLRGRPSRCARTAAPTSAPRTGSTRVSAGELVATVRPRDPATEDGWDVSGGPVSLPTEAHEALQAGRGVREDLQPDGGVRFTAEAVGELVRDGAVLSVMQVAQHRRQRRHGNRQRQFSPATSTSAARCARALRSWQAESCEIGAAVEAALLSAGGTISIAQGIKGEGKAILRSRRDIESMFAEQAVLLAIGDVHLRGPCVRCQIKCNGKLVLDSEKGSLVGGEVRVSRGAVLQNIGSPGGVHTIVTFGQDFLVKDQIEREEREVAALAAESRRPRRRHGPPAEAGRSGGCPRKGSPRSRRRPRPCPGARRRS